MAMAESGGVACRCREMGSYFVREVRLLGKQRIKKNLRSFSIVPFFRSSLLNRRRLIARNNCIISMDAQEKSRSRILKSSKHKRVPVYVMMPVNIFGMDSSGNMRIRKIKALSVSLKALKLAGVHGVAVEVWWGIVERFSPLTYNWSVYEELFKLISESGLKLHAALSFHSDIRLTSRGKEGVSLPQWILEIGSCNKDIYYQDQNGLSNDDYLTLGVDNFPLFSGRTALQCYEDFILSFLNKFDHFIGGMIEEISIGLGPSGELRYPAHPFGDGRWKFPGIGEFQCYDKYMMDDLKMAACRVGKPQWGKRGPRNAGCYNSFPSGTPFFEEGDESFLSDYGHFFLEWYSGRLIHHADAILGKAATMLKKYQQSNQPSVILVAKLGGIHWWYKTISHPAELTAGYYNTAGRDGYDPVTSMLSRHGAALHIPF
ncbi:inactive beta-amylase 4, chloroplastic isoform X2 [Momordica charantia]|uniref:Beta-amylase n=1 Tax=Momordica charantia TaxID=3673 RepID=A0A6J1DV74_MOMCH|nr:inactive beta-amylase 4, chloroplastic isoform X2 [Momordica charantia]